MNASQRRTANRKFYKEIMPRLVYARMLGMTKKQTFEILEAPAGRGKSMLEDFIKDKT